MFFLIQAGTHTQPSPAVGTLVSAETISRLFDYSVGMALFDSLKHYSIIR